MSPGNDDAANPGGIDGARAPQQNDQHANGNSRAEQQQRLLRALRVGPVTTFASRTQHDVSHPAGRVQELREQGFDIATLWSTELSDAGTKHRIARYVLLGEPRQQIAREC